jgi:hypothetical protein
VPRLASSFRRRPPCPTRVHAISLALAARSKERLRLPQSTLPSTQLPSPKVLGLSEAGGVLANMHSVGLSRPTVPDTIDEDKSDEDDVEESAPDPTAQAIFNLVHGACSNLHVDDSG